VHRDIYNKLNLNMSIKHPTTKAKACPIVGTPRELCDCVSFTSLTGKGCPIEHRP